MSIALSIGNNLTTNGVFTADAVNNTSVTNVTDFASVPGGGVLKLLSTQTASASATIDFTSGIDSTYDSYVFKFINMHPATSSAHFTFNMSTDGGSNYNVTKTTTYFHSAHDEADSATEVAYQTPSDLAQSTDFHRLQNFSANSDDSSCSGVLHIYNPASTTFIKHFTSTFNSMSYTSTPYSLNAFTAGYGNTTSAVDAIQFKYSSGNIDDGIIKMYGVV
jgi:hypothetical protein